MSALLTLARLCRDAESPATLPVLYGLKGGAIRLLGYYLIAPLFAMNPVRPSVLPMVLAGSADLPKGHGILDPGQLVRDLQESDHDELIQHRKRGRESSVVLTVFITPGSLFSCAQGSCFLLSPSCSGRTSVSSSNIPIHTSDQQPEFLISFFLSQPLHGRPEAPLPTWPPRHPRYLLRRRGVHRPPRLHVYLPQQA